MRDALMLTSPAFANGEMIPAKYTCDGAQLSPPLLISGVPGEARSLVLIMDDPDIPEAVRQAHGIEVFDHWVLYNIPPDTREIPEDSTVGTPGLNGVGSREYVGPCPPSEYEPKEHRYIFALYTLKRELHFASLPTKLEVLSAMEGELLQEATLIGRYSRG